MTDGTTWFDEVTAARDEGFTFFDWLSAVDEADGTFTVAIHLWSVERRESRLLKTVVTDAVPSVVGVFKGAAWHERETHEMFGIAFTGSDDVRPLLLPPGFQGHPLRKGFPLAARAAKAWPGAKEPGESDVDLLAPAARARRGNVPPGVPEGWPAGVPTETTRPAGVRRPDGVQQPGGDQRSGEPE